MTDASKSAKGLPVGGELSLAEFGACDVEAVQIVAEDGGKTRGNLYSPRGERSRIGVQIMHPRADQSYNYAIPPLLQAGCLVLARAGRWVNNDTETIHETLLLDVAAGIRLLHEWGCDQVVLLGNSGGAPLAAMYQWQARTALAERVRETPAGDPAGLVDADLPAADGLALLAGHLGEAIALKKRIDPSVVDEADPLSCDPALDMYDARNGFRTPPESSLYADDFLQRYHAGQRTRVERLDAMARAALAERQAAEEALSADGSQAQERSAMLGRHLVVHRTMADPAMLDLAIDPDDRRLGTYTNQLRPDLLNYGAGPAGAGGHGSGLVKFLTPEAWLSTWSAISSRAATGPCLSHVSDPLLIVHYAGDAVTSLREIQSVFDVAGSPDKTLLIVGHADHFGFIVNPDGSGGDRTTKGTDAVVAWLRERFAR